MPKKEDNSEKQSFLSQPLSFWTVSLKAFIWENKQRWYSKVHKQLNFPSRYLQDFQQIHKAQWSKKLFRKHAKLNFMPWQVYASLLMMYKKCINKHWGVFREVVFLGGIFCGGIHHRGIFSGGGSREGIFRGGVLPVPYNRTFVYIVNSFLL